MAKKTPQEITPESVDDMTDEQVTEFLQQTEDTQEDTQEETPEVADNGDDAPKEEAAKPEDAKQEETAKAEKPEDAGDDSEQAENVPFKRYDYERNRRKEAEQKLEAERAEATRRLEEILKAQTKPKQEESAPEIPSWDTDPIKAGQWTQEQLLEMQNAQREQQEARDKAIQEQNEQQALLQGAAAEFQAIEQADPTARQAYDALVQSFAKEAEAYGIPPQGMQQHLAQTEMQHIAYARQNNIPLDRYIKGLATARGWAPQAAQAKQETPAVDHAEASKKAKTLSNGGGSPGVSDSLTAEQILSMSEKDFNAFIEKHGSVSGYLESA